MDAGGTQHQAAVILLQLECYSKARKVGGGRSVGGEEEADFYL